MAKARAQQRRKTNSRTRRREPDSRRSADPPKTQLVQRDSCLALPGGLLQRRAGRSHRSTHRTANRVYRMTPGSRRSFARAAGEQRGSSRLIHYAADRQAHFFRDGVLLVLAFWFAARFAFRSRAWSARAPGRTSDRRGAARPSVAVAASLEGEMLWAEGFGWADGESELKATPDTAYGLGFGVTNQSRPRPS